MKYNQIEMVTLDSMVPEKHRYRKYTKLFDFKKIEYRLKKLESKIGRTGYGQVCLFRCLLLQYMEDLSDRQLEEFLSTNSVAKWLCGFSLIEKIRPQFIQLSEEKDRHKTIIKVF